MGRWAKGTGCGASEAIVFLMTMMGKPDKCQQGIEGKCLVSCPALPCHALLCPA